MSDLPPGLPPGPPVAEVRRYDVGQIAVEAVNAVIRPPLAVIQKRMAPTESVHEVLSDPFGLMHRRKAAEQRALCNRARLAAR